MASTTVLKQRIKSVRGTRQITKAMQLVSASKMRKAQDYAFKSRDYRDAAYELLTKLNTTREVEQQPLFAKRPVKNKLYVIVTSNSGLAGAYNSNVLKELAQSLTSDKKIGITSQVISVGSKGAQFVRRIQNVELLAVYASFPEQPTANDLRPILNTIIGLYRDESIDEVRILYTLYKSSISQVAQNLQVLPASTLELGTANGQLITNFEPDIESVINEVGTRLVEAQLYQAILESLASEHSMRMIAMKNATDNANDLIHDYTLEYNTARQAGITQELAEITGGAEALNG
jgi:F-type H+-transporting ATPase subunit gamma